MKNVFIGSEQIEDAYNVCGEIKACLHGDRKYFIESYGCQMNDHDSEVLRGFLGLCGYQEAEKSADADIILFNTCCVREHAELRVLGNIGALRKLKEERPELIIGVCGCMMQQKPVADKLYKRFPYVDLIFGTNELHRFPMLLMEVLNGARVNTVEDSYGVIAEALPIERRCSFSGNVIITYGCNNFCSYCIVPYVRGRERSRGADEVVNEVRALADAGCLEVTLIGQNVNSYMSPDGLTDFPRLLKRISEETAIPRIRFMTSHPKDLSDELIEAMTLPRVCNHIHLPVQSGSDRILALMNRRYDSARYLERVAKLRDAVPGIELTTDIIVGFPGETEDDFEATLRLVRKARFSAAYTFMYSPRTGTKAATMEEQIPTTIKKCRLAKLNALQSSILRAANPSYIGLRGEVLAEGSYEKNGVSFAYGKLKNAKMVYFPGSGDDVGKMIEVEVFKAEKNSLFGERTK